MKPPHKCILLDLLDLLDLVVAVMAQLTKFSTLLVAGSAPPAAAMSAY